MMQEEEPKFSFVQEEKPGFPFALCFIAGLSILIVGLFVYLNPTSIPDSAPIWFLTFGVITGIIVITASFTLYFKPEQHVICGIIIVIFSILSFPSTAGLSLGFFAGTIGGALGIVWKPGLALPFYRSPSILSLMHGYSQACPQCGRIVFKDIKICPFCGKNLKEEQPDIE